MRKIKVFLPGKFIFIVRGHGHGAVRTRQAASRSPVASGSLSLRLGDNRDSSMSGGIFNMLYVGAIFTVARGRDPAESGRHSGECRSVIK